MWAASQPRPRMLLNALLSWIKAWQPSLIPKQEEKMGPLVPRRISVLSPAGESQLPAALAFILFFVWVYVCGCRRAFLLFFFLLWKWMLFVVQPCSLLVLKKKGVPTGHWDSGAVCPENVLGEHGFRAGFESKIYHLLTWGALGTLLAFLSHPFSSVEWIISNPTRSFLSKIKIDHGCKVFS